MRERDYFEMKPREFDRLYRGFLLREERQWERIRDLIFITIKVNTNKWPKKPEDIRRLPIIDALKPKVIHQDNDVHERLRTLAAKLNKTNK